ncbi:putative patatin-like phospholipase [Chitinispirillum alkaliphilum]|nr:putative patatin-like phospholipase [Chitinispirillum alkaliphilum]
MKKFQISIVLLLLTLYSVIRSEENYRFALVLSGGGARGLAQIGVLKAFEENGLRPDLIVATSMGSIIGGLYACGLSPEQIYQFTQNLDWGNLINDDAKRDNLFVNQKQFNVNYLFELFFDQRLRPVFPSSISHGQSFYQILTPLLLPAQYRAGNDFSNLPISLRIVTTDILTGNRVVLRDGNLARAIRASSTVPLAFSPLKYDGMVLMDGGLASNIPVETAIEEMADFVVAVDVTSSLLQKPDLDNPVRLVNQLVAIGIEKNKNRERVLADIVITPDLEGFSNTNFRNHDTLVQIGYLAAMEQMDEILKNFPEQQINRSPQAAQIPLRVVNKSGVKLFTGDTLKIDKNLSDEETLSAIKNYLHSNGIDFPDILSVSKTDSVLTVIAEPAKVNDFNFLGLQKTSGYIVRRAGGLRKGETISQPRIESMISNLYSTGLFKTVNVEIDSQNILNVIVDEKKPLRLRAGLRYDEFHLLEGFIQPANQNLFGTGITTQLHLQYGSRREKYALKLNANHLLTANLANNLQFKAYVSKERLFERKIIPQEGQSDLLSIREIILRKTGFMVMTGTQVGKFASLNGGMRYELFKLQQSDNSVFKDGMGLKFPGEMPYFMLRLIIDTMDKTPFPTKGFNHIVTFGTASNKLAGTEDFVKIDGSSGAYFSLGSAQKHVLHPRFVWAWSNSPLPETEKVYLGGAFSEQGYRDLGLYNYVPFIGLKPRAFSGDLLALLHLNYIWELRDNFYLTFDFDYGRTWLKQDFSLSNFREEFFDRALLGVGAGMAYNSIFGPLRLSYGHLIRGLEEIGIERGYQLYISLGQDF